MFSVILWDVTELGSRGIDNVYKNITTLLVMIKISNLAEIKTCLSHILNSADWFTALN